MVVHLDNLPPSLELPVVLVNEKVIKAAPMGSKQSHAMVAFACVGYALSTSLMLVLNKLLAYELGYASFVLLAQTGGSALAVAVVARMTSIDLSKVKSFFPVALAFVAGIFTNIKALEHASIETVIVFRASTPIAVAIADFVFLGRELPQAQSWVALLGVVMGSLGYFIMDNAHHISGYLWLCVWYVFFCFDQVFIKHAIDTVPVSNLERVFYTNIISAGLLLLKAVHEQVYDAAYRYASFPRFEQYDLASAATLLLSCVVAVGVSYFTFLCRELLSASSFTVIGNCCKIMTVPVANLVTERGQRAGPRGIACLCICLLCSYFYEQPPKRADVKSKNVAE